MGAELETKRFDADSYTMRRVMRELVGKVATMESRLRQLEQHVFPAAHATALDAGSLPQGLQLDTFATRRSSEADDASSIASFVHYLVEPRDLFIGADASEDGSSVCGSVSAVGVGNDDVPHAEIGMGVSDVPSAELTIGMNSGGSEDTEILVAALLLVNDIGSDISVDSAQAPVDSCGVDALAGSNMALPVVDTNTDSPRSTTVVDEITRTNTDPGTIPPVEVCPQSGFGTSYGLPATLSRNSLDGVTEAPSLGALLSAVHGADRNPALRQPVCHTLPDTASGADRESFHESQDDETLTRDELSEEVKLSLLSGPLSVGELASRFAADYHLIREMEELPRTWLLLFLQSVHGLAVGFSSRREEWDVSLTPSCRSKVRKRARRA